jgi:PncC family amidohydrolase
MLIGCFDKFGSDVVCSITGIAGPEGGSDLKPVGTVFVGLKIFDEIVVERCLFTGNRDVVRVKSCEYLVMMMLRFLSHKGNH